MKSILLALALGIVPARAEERAVPARPEVPAAAARAEETTRAAPRVSEPLKTKQTGRHGKPPVDGVVNVNRASEAELRLLPGIGKGRAKAIVERRSKRPFTDLDDLARMKGMKSVVRKLRPHLATEGETTVHRHRP